MTFKSVLAGASTALLVAVGSANASTVTSIDPADVIGTFSASFEVTAVNVTKVDRDESWAAVENFNNALAEATNPLVDTFGDGDESFAFDTFFYTGPLRFGTNSGSVTTVGDFLNTGVAMAGFSPISTRPSRASSTARVGSGC